MIADKHHQQAFIAHALLQRPKPIINTQQIKIGGFFTKITYGGFYCGHELLLCFINLNGTLFRNYSVPLLEKEGLGEILFNKSPSIPLLQRGKQ
jgi:hypothetical protein